MSTSVAVYPGTFDPITLGHVDIVSRAASLFDRVIVAVDQSERKAPCFSVGERVELCERVLADRDNVEVQSFQGVLVDFAVTVGAGALIRGLRSSSDYEYEYPLASMNQTLQATVDTVFLASRPALVGISSSLVRQLITLDRDVSAFVPEAVVQFLQDR